MKGKTEGALSLRNESLCKANQWQWLVSCTASLRLSLGSTQRKPKQKQGFESSVLRCPHLV